MPKTVLPPLDNPPTLKSPPKSPPINIPKKKKKRRSKRKIGLFFSNDSKNVKKFYTNRFENNSVSKLRELTDELTEMRNNLDIFLNLKKGDKLGKHEVIVTKKVDDKIDQEKDSNDESEKNDDNKATKQKKYYKNDADSYGQWLSRWWWGESRDKTLDYLDEDFTAFVNYLDRILSQLECDPLAVYVNLVNEIREFISDILTGLYSLKETYPEYVKMVAKVDSIIFTLLDFKEKTDDYLRQKNQNVQLTIKKSGIPIPLQVPDTGEPKYSDMPNNSV